MAIVTIVFPHLNLSGTFEVTRVGENEVRFDEVPFLMDDLIGFRDIVEVDEKPDGSLSFVRLTKRSDWQTHSFVLSKEQVDSPLIEEACKRAEIAGVHWVRIFGGLLFFCVPPGSDFDPARELTELFGTSAPR